MAHKNCINIFLTIYLTGPFFGTILGDNEDHKWVFYTATNHDIYVVAAYSYWTCVDGPDCRHDEIPGELWRGT